MVKMTTTTLDDNSNEQEKPSKKDKKSNPLHSKNAKIINNLDVKLNEILKREIIQRQKKQDREASEYKTLENITTEFLKSFIIIGYTLKGEKIIIGHANSQQENDSLIENLRQTFFNIVGDADMSDE